MRILKWVWVSKARYSLKTVLGDYCFPCFAPRNPLIIFFEGDLMPVVERMKAGVSLLVVAEAKKK